MHISLLHLIVSASGEGGFETTTGLSWFIFPAIVIISILLVILLGAYLFQAFINTRKVSMDWDQFESLIDQIQLSTEEACFIRTNLRKLGYSNPTDILRKEGDFDRFFKKVLRRPNHHYEFLLQTIRKKAFTGNRRAKNDSIHEKKAPVGQTEV